MYYSIITWSLFWKIRTLLLIFACIARAEGYYMRTKGEGSEIVKLSRLRLWMAPNTDVYPCNEKLPLETIFIQRLLYN